MSFPCALVVVFGESFRAVLDCLYRHLGSLPAENVQLPVLKLVRR